MSELHPCRGMTGYLKRRALRRFLAENGDDIPSKDIRSSTTLKNVRYWTTYCDDRGIATAMRFHPNDWYLCTVKNAAVRKDLRGKGLGRKLYREVSERALAERTPEGWPRCHVLTADVTFDNKPSIKALVRAGYRQVGRFCWGKGQKPADILHYVRVPSKGTTCGR